MAERTPISEVLAAGEPGAVSELMPVIYDELRGLARTYLRREGAAHTLQPTALANEAYLRLVDADIAGLQGRLHFFAIAAKTMRRVLVDHARRKGAIKRGGGRARLTLSSTDLEGAQPLDVLDLEEALEALAEHDERKARVVELRFFAGLAVKEVALLLGIAPKTVAADWYMARAWLERRIA